MVVPGHMYYVCVELGVVSITVKEMPCRVSGVILVPRVTRPCRAMVDSTELSLVTPSCPACRAKKVFQRGWGQAQLFLTSFWKEKEEISFSEVQQKTCASARSNLPACWSKVGGCGFITTS